MKKAILILLAAVLCFAAAGNAQELPGLPFPQPSVFAPDGPASPAYLLRVLDQHGAPVSGVYVSFCTDTACTLLQTDENGLIALDEAPDACHVQVIDAPEGYAFDADAEPCLQDASGEWTLQIQKIDPASEGQE